MNRNAPAFAAFAISCLAITASCLAQMPAGWQDQLTDDTWIVGRFASAAEYLRWMPDEALRPAIEAASGEPGPVIFLATGSSFRVLIPDPEQAALKILRDSSSPRRQVVQSHADGITLVETAFSGLAIQATAPSEETRSGWTSLMGEPGSGPLTIGVMARGEVGRVVRELLPAMVNAPPQLNLQQLLADTESIQVRFLDRPDRLAELSVNAQDSEAAARVAAAVPALRHWIGTLEPFKPRFAQDLADMVLGGAIEATESTVRIDARVAAGQPGLNELLESLRERDLAIQSMNHVKLLVLALHNFESAYKEFPGPTIGNGDSPGLSWRVAILPFIDEGDLYNEFHLDEPWDSEHNRKLIPRMPAIFLHPRSAHRTTDGRSSFIVPTAEGCAHQPGVTRRFEDFRDGSSNSILILAVTDETAPAWTQPVTKNIDLTRPRAGLWRSGDGEYLIGRCDGSTELISESNSDETLRALLTINGGETVGEIK